jgi:SAM-dependent methyltransferase
MQPARYDAVADFYVREFMTVGDPVSRALLSLLGPAAGLRVLDAACGHGRMTRELARRGAEVVGVDVSAAMISKAAAAEREQPLGIRYVHADLGAPGWLAPATFDAVTCHFGLSDVDDLDQALAAVAAALRPGGRFVFSILHPCFPGAAGVSGSWPTEGRYYDEGHWTAGDALSTLRRQVGANHRMISTYLNTLRRSHLGLDQVSEPEPDPQWSEKRQDAGRGPVYFVARCLKANAR